jgi:hypothetical protein
VSFAIVVGSLKQVDGGDTFQCDCGDGKIIECTIVDIALRDLIDFHRFKKTADPSTVLVLEIVRLANAKYDAGRLEEDGSLVIRATDLLRFGFGNRKVGSDQAHPRNNQLSGTPAAEGSNTDKKALRSLLSVITRAAKVESAFVSATTRRSGSLAMPVRSSPGERPRL